MGHRMSSERYREAQNCPACALKGRYVMLVRRPADGFGSPEMVEALLTPVSQIDLEAVPPLHVDGFPKLRGALNGIRRRTVYLTSGDPGIGKSTLLTQIALALPRIGGVLPSVCYVSAEEPREAVAERARRVNRAGVALDGVYVYESGDVGQLESALDFESTPPFDLLVVDSIQTVWSPLLESPPGSVGQVTFCTNILKRLAREHDLTVWLLAHVTKDGSVAGPKTLEHLVDVVTMVEQDDAEHIARDRRLTISKNRRGRLAGPVLFTVETTGAWRER